MVKLSNRFLAKPDGNVKDSKGLLGQMKNPHSIYLSCLWGEVLEFVNQSIL